MKVNTFVNQTNVKSDLNRKIRKRKVQVIVQFLILAAILFISSGQLDWMWAWVYLGVSVGILIINLFVVSPELMAERSEIKENVKSWDKVLATLISILTLNEFVVSGLDKRFGWSPQLGLTIHLLALVFWTLGQGLFSWAMASNKFFSGAVRIQMDRNHTVVTSGPYQYVRHPGYLGYIISFCLTTPLALGSLWALVAGGLGALLLIIRTALEDRTLLEELDGYKEYAQQVRYRLLPGIW
ncbi:MAG: methyltransferase family protein [Thermoproteota archaeon]